MAESLLIGVTLIVMVVVLLVSFIPFVPGPALMWLVAVVFGVVNEFDRLPVIVLAGMTLLMLIGSTTDLWMPFIGLRSSGASCWSILGTLVGGIVGSFVIPIPICGTFIGAILGALLFEMLHAGNIQLALNAGRAAFKSILMGLAVEVTTTILLFIAFVVSLVITG